MSKTLLIVYTSEFKSCYKMMKKRHKDLKKLQIIVERLSNRIPLEARYKDHALVGNYFGNRECHIEPDWLLIYRISEDKLILILVATGSHSDLLT